MTMPNKARVVSSWLLQVVVGVAFVPIGLAKFNDPMWVRGFEHWGYPPAFRILIGVIEATGGAMLLVPRLTSYAALLLGGVMVGAIGTHAMAHQPWFRPLPHLTILLVLAWLRWPSRWRNTVGVPAGAVGGS
jgi:putative oxidoreductase